MKKPAGAGFFLWIGKAVLQNTPKSISNKITVMGTPSSQAMMGIGSSFQEVC
jgi:hypothetical protein